MQPTQDSQIVSWRLDEDIVVKCVGFFFKHYLCTMMNKYRQQALKWRNLLLFLILILALLTVCICIYLTPGVLSSPSLSSSSVSGPARLRGLGPDKGPELPSRAFMALFLILALADASPSSSSSSGSRCSIRTLNCME